MTEGPALGELARAVDRLAGNVEKLEGVIGALDQRYVLQAVDKERERTRALELAAMKEADDDRHQEIVDLRERVTWAWRTGLSAFAAVAIYVIQQIISHGGAHP